MADLFISYAKADRSLATELADDLRERGFSVWIDQSGIKGAKNWSAEIVEGINSCSTLIVLLSPDSIASHNVAKEVQLASEKRKNILPVVIEKVVLPANFEYSLVGLQRVYYHDRPAIISALEMLKGTMAGALSGGMNEIMSGADVPSPADRIGHPADTSIRVAVLPFDDLSPKHDNQWFADGMMDELISTLGHLDKVKVPGRSDVLHYREHRVKSREIARELGVRYLIEGGVRKAAERIRINASLIDSQKTEQLWADQFDGSFDDVFEFQESVARQITEALKLQLSPREEEQIEKRPTENAEAYELYLKARHEQYYVTKESYERALELYGKAVALDPNFAQANIGIASVCCYYYREYSRKPQWIARAEASVAAAESVLGETSLSLWIRGMIQWLKGDDEAAISTLTRSTDLDPRNYSAFNVIGTIHIVRSNYVAAVDVFQRAVDITESTQEYFNLLIALRESKESSRLMATAQKALKVFDRYLLWEKNDLNTAVFRAFVLLWSGRREEASEAANHLLNLSGLSGYSLYNLGCLYDQLGKPELYVSLLRKAINHGYREIEQTRTYTFVTKDPQCELELQILVREFEDLNKIEKAVTTD